MSVYYRRGRISWRFVLEHWTTERRVASYSAGYGNGRSVGHTDTVSWFQTRQTLPDLHAGI